jgi:glutathione S-transferase
MSEFVIHGIPGSPYVRAPLLALEEKGADWSLAALGMGQHRAPGHLSRQPFGRVPALEHGDFLLYETQAILRYIDRVLPEPSLTPGGIREEARMNQVMGITDWYVMPNISAGITFARLVAPRFGIPVDENRIAGCMAPAAVCVAELARLLGEGTWMAGESLSLADLILIPHMDFLNQTAEGETLLEPYPALKAWIDRMNDRPSLRATTWDRLAERSKAA